MGQKYYQGRCDGVQRVYDFSVKSDVRQLGSDKQSGEEVGDEEVETEDSSETRQKINTGLKERHDAKPGISRRLRGIFQSLFHLDKREKTNSQTPCRISAQLDSEYPSLEHPSYPKSRSLPNLYRTGKSAKKPLFATLLRKSRRRISSFRHKNRSMVSFYSVKSNENLPNFSRFSLRECKSSGYTDESVPNSPAHNDCRNVFYSSVECSPASVKKHSSTTLEENGKNCAKLRRERFRRSKTTDVGYKRHNSERFTSFSESSDVTEEGDSIDLNDVIISNASFAVQNRRKVPNGTQTPTVDEGLLEENDCKEKETQNLKSERQSSKEKWMKALSQVAELELKMNLCNRIFDPQKSKEWCSDIGELMRDKIQTETKGGFKIIVQVFIGAVEGDGIRTATQCNLNPRSDDLTVVSFRNDSLFAFASLFVVDVREH